MNTRAIRLRVCIHLPATHLTVLNHPASGLHCWQSISCIPIQNSHKPMYHPRMRYSNEAKCHQIKHTHINPIPTMHCSCVYACAFACVCVCMCVCLHVCVCMCVHVCMCCVHACVCVCSVCVQCVCVVCVCSVCVQCVCAVCVCVCVCMCVGVHVCMRVCVITYGCSPQISSV